MGTKSICFRYTRADQQPFVYIIGIQQSFLIYDACHLFLPPSPAIEKQNDGNLTFKKNKQKKGFETVSVWICCSEIGFFTPKNPQPVPVITDRADRSP